MSCARAGGSFVVHRSDAPNNERGAILRACSSFQQAQGAKHGSAAVDCGGDSVKLWPQVSGSQAMCLDGNTRVCGSRVMQRNAQISGYSRRNGFKRDDQALLCRIARSQARQSPANRSTACLLPPMDGGGAGRGVFNDGAAPALRRVHAHMAPSGRAGHAKYKEPRVGECRHARSGLRTAASRKV